jgi:GT2 family glycosyltransferase
VSAVARAPAATRATVVVCTRNRSQALAAACEGALAGEAPFAWELLVVDNGSTDDTRDVAAAIAARHPGRMRVAVERTLGLSAARNLGVRLAATPLVLFLDDDAVPAPGWLAAYDRALSADGVLAAGGPVDPDFAGPLPPWFGAGYLPYVSAWDRGPEPHRLSYNEYPRGANMGFRREAFERWGDFDLRLGRIGRSLRSCEEIELCLRLDRAGAAVVYEPGARVRHRVETERLTPAWLVARFASQGFSEAILEWKHFGFAGLRRGLAGHREALRRARAAPPGAEGAGAGEGGAAGLERRCRRAALGAYRKGALYGLLVVARWSPSRTRERSGDDGAS